MQTFPVGWGLSVPRRAIYAVLAALGFAGAGYAWSLSVDSGVRDDPIWTSIAVISAVLAVVSALTGFFVEWSDKKHAKKYSEFLQSAERELSRDKGRF